MIMMAGMTDAAIPTVAANIPGPNGRIRLNAYLAFRICIARYRAVAQPDKRPGPNAGFLASLTLKVRPRC